MNDDDFREQVHDLMIQNDNIERATKELKDEDLRELDVKMTSILIGLENLGEWIKEKLND